MQNRSRRDFLADVGQGMLIASVGPALLSDLAMAHAFVVDGPERLTFGDREPLVALLQDTPADKLLPILVDKIKSGTDMKDLVAAGALANARTFGGQDYDGYHAFMALLPSLQISKEMPDDRKALPVLKVLYRNTARMQVKGGSSKEVLHPISGSDLPQDRTGGQVLQEQTRKKDYDSAEKTFASLAKKSTDQAYNDLLLTVQDEVDVHRVVLAWRAWAVLDVVGKEHAHSVLRQSVRFCISENRDGRGVRETLPKLLDQYKLMAKSIGDKKGDDAWTEKLAMTIYSASRPQAAEAVAAALAEGFSPEAIGEAMSLAATRLVLCDPGRKGKQISPGKPEGSIHGASVGVHASDSANAWRNIARVANQRNTVASLIVGAYHAAGQSGGLNKDPQPLAEQVEKITIKDCHELLTETEVAIKANDQARAVALIHRYGELKFPEKCVFDLMRKYAVSEDGALHAEKYFRTVTEEFANTRPSMRWRHLLALARVTASEQGFPAPGYQEACKLLKV